MRIVDLTQPVRVTWELMLSTPNSTTILKALSILTYTTTSNLCRLSKVLERSEVTTALDVILHTTTTALLRTLISSYLLM